MNRFLFGERVELINENASEASAPADRSQFCHMKDFSSRARRNAPSRKLNMVVHHKAHVIMEMNSEK